MSEGAIARPYARPPPPAPAWHAAAPLPPPPPPPPPPTDVSLAVLGIRPPAASAYAAGRTVGFEVTLSKAAQVRGVPQLLIAAGKAQRKATYVSGSGSPTLVFQYVVGRSDGTADVAVGQGFLFPKKSGIVSGSESLGPGLPAGIAGQSMAGVQFDAVPPKVVGPVAVPGVGTYAVGQALNFVVRFSEAVTVVGAPQISVAGLSAARQAIYVSGSGSQELTFRYVVQAGDSPAGKKGLSLAKTITLPPSAAISDSAGNRPALKISAAAMKSVRIDATALAFLGRQGGRS